MVARGFHPTVIKLNHSKNRLATACPRPPNSPWASYDAPSGLASIASIVQSGPPDAAPPTNQPCANAMARAPLVKLTYESVPEIELTFVDIKDTRRH